MAAAAAREALDRSALSISPSLAACAPLAADDGLADDAAPRAALGDAARAVMTEGDAAERDEALDRAVLGRAPVEATVEDARFRGV